MNNVGDLNKVWEIKALKRKPGEEEARKILDKIAKQVQPIMRKRNWRVKVLSEMCPKNPALLGLNVGRGVNVKLRLRRANRDWDFIPFDQVLDTMLHELCHNAHGPHNANFYKLWDELRKECEELMSKGISGTGEGFDLPGRRLGGFSCQPPLSSLRQTALSAAEKRVCMGSLLGSGPKRLGGDNSIMAALSPVQAAAMAAERRYQDDIWCGFESCEVDEEGENSSDLMQKNVLQSTGNLRSCCGLHAHASDAVHQKRSRESNTFQLSESSNGRIGSSFSDLTGVTSVSGSKLDVDAVSKKRTRQMDKKSSPQSWDDHPKPTFIDLSTEPSTSGYACNQDAKANTEKSKMWECVTCTLLNPPLAPICELCSTQKPKEVADKYKVWGCKFCTLENSMKLDKCKACGQWRYSHGPPVAAPPPNLGT